MRSRLIPALAAAALVSALAAATVAGGVTQTYHGVFSGKVEYSADCTGVPATDVMAEGVWNVAIHKDDATVTITIFRDGKHHVSYGIAAEVLQRGPNFKVSYTTGAGVVVMSRAGDDVTYAIAPYTYDPVVCEMGGVAYHGEVR